MKKTLLFFTLAALAPASAWAQGTGGKFYVDWDNAAKKCVVVETKPANNNVEGGGPYNSKAEAETALKTTIVGCSGAPMKK
jgi:hypothetical protein